MKVPAPASQWQNSGRWTFGLGAAYAVENAIPRNVSHVNLAWAAPQVGLVAWQSPESFIRRFDLIDEGMLGASPNPGGYVAGNTLLLRLEGPPVHRRLTPFFEFGAGVLRTDLNNHASELDGHTQFCPQGGLGVQYFIQPQRAIIFEYRYMHMSNANLQLPNLGFNSSMIVVGFRWLQRPPSRDQVRSSSLRSLNPLRLLGRG